jgi:multidrug efflux system outer membrane protein
MRRLFLVSFSAVLLAVLAGCQTGPKDQSDRLGIDIPDQYGMSPGGGVDDWLSDFESQVLRDLVYESLEHNYNLRAAGERLEAARRTAFISGGARLPSFDSRFRGSRSQRNASQGFNLVSSQNNTFVMDFTAAWEIDLWGRMRNQHKASIADYEASQADYLGARLSLAANTARAWFNAIESEQLVQLSLQTVESFENNQQVIEDGYERGVYRALDVRLTRANVESARSNLNLNKRLRDASARSLEVLLGRYPGNEIEVVTELPEMQRPIPGGIPSELLRRRPDLIAAERALAAATQRAKAAAKSMLPSISLSVTGGRSSSELRDIIDPERNIWTLAGNVAQPLLRGGRLKNAYERNRANERQALANYAQAALQAFQDVETTLAAEEFLNEQEVALRASAEESALAEDLAWDEYQKGLATIVTVLESQRRSFNSQTALIRINNDRLQNRLNLYLSLGGAIGGSSEVETVVE